MEKRKRGSWCPTDLPLRTSIACRGARREKVAIARLAWEQTAVNMKWIAGQLRLRSAANASQQIRRQRKDEPDHPMALKQWIIRSRNVA